MEPLFGTPELAAGYAQSRPAVHARVIERVRRFLAIEATLHCAVDVGCGAGLSTRPLTGLAEVAVGMEPLEPMLAWAAEVAPGAKFVVGRAEVLPFGDRVADLMTAAGSLNYVGLDLFFREARRVLRADGRLVVYDFSQGKRMRNSAALEEWFARFRERFPARASSGRPLSPETLVPLAERFRAIGHEYYEEGLWMEPGFYVNYMMTETNVAAAVQAGIDAEEIREWCLETTAPIFGGAAREVLFNGYIAYFAPL